MAHGERQSRGLGLLRDSRGNATAEAVIMLPFFIMVWGCIIWASQSFENEIDLASVARQHAWQNSMNNCNGATGTGTTVTRAENTDLGPVDAAFGLVDSVVGLLPGLRDFWPGLTFDEFQYVREDTVKAPAVTGADDRQTYFRVVLMCNEEHDTPDLEESATGAFGVFGGGL